MKQTIKRFVSTILILLLIVVAGVGAFIYSGVYDIGADDPHTRPVFSLLQTLRDRSIAAHAKDLRVPDLADATLVLKHGIKMSAMPAWGGSHDDATIWSMVAFLQKLPDLSPKQYKEIVARAPPDDDMDMGQGNEHDHGAGKDDHDKNAEPGPAMAMPAKPASASLAARKSGTF
jgi:hypothetical protein